MRRPNGAACRPWRDNQASPPVRNHQGANDERNCQAVDDESPCLSWAGKEDFEDHAKPEVPAPTDAIVKITKTTICGTDLHILKGDLPSCQPGRILGHEGVGVIDRVGSAVTAFKPGDRVLISCVSACGKCEYCRKGMFSHCTTGGWILGNTIDGTQAEFVRIPMPTPASIRFPMARTKKRW